MSVPTGLLFNLQSGSATNGMSACAAPNGSTADDPDPNVLQIQRKKKNICIQQLHQGCINTPRSNPHVDC